MWKFLKRLLTDEKGSVALLTLEDNDPGKAETFVIKKSSLIWSIIVILIFSLILVFLFYFFTPLSTIYQKQMDTALRGEVIEISERVEALQDSLMIRDNQLNDLKNFIRNVPDTTFNIQSDQRGRAPQQGNNYTANGIEIPSYEMLNRYNVIHSSSSMDEVNFNPDTPLNGRLTQGYSSARGHYGIDILADRGSPFRSVESGIVLYTEWSINFGYVIMIQHGSGYMSVYKHAESLIKKQGDVVLKGSILGNIGNSGVLSTGPHLHIEIWENGIPVDPLFFIVL